MAKLAEIKGIGESYTQKPQEASVGTLDQLHEKGAAPTGRKEIAKRTGVSEKLTLTGSTWQIFFASRVLVKSILICSRQ